MHQPLTIKPERLERAVRLRAENDNGAPAALVLKVPTQQGGFFNVTVTDDWQPVDEKPEGELGNTLISVCPVAEIHRKRPLKTSGVTVRGGRAVSTLRPGYLYVFRGQALWREFAIDPDGTLREVNLTAARQDKTAPRVPKGAPVTHFLVPALLNNRFELTGCRVAYSEAQWSWPYIEQLEGASRELEKRAMSIAPAWAVVLDDTLTFDSGFPASAIPSVPALRPRDLGVELMLADPSGFTPTFRKPDDHELIARVTRRWQQISGDNGASPPDLRVEAEPAEDTLASARKYPAITCVAIPDPLFRFRHALAQLHLALHYLDAIDLSLKQKPLVHSAMLIRQTLFDPQAPASDTRFDKLRAAVDQSKLHEILDQEERQNVLEEIGEHLDTLESLVLSGEFSAASNDYLNQEGLGPCEALALQADLMSVVQQLRSVLSAQGLEVPGALTRLLRQSLAQNPVMDGLTSTGSSKVPPLLRRLQTLAENQQTLTEEHLNTVGLSSLAALTQQKAYEEDGAGNNYVPVASVRAAGSVASMVKTALEGWSASALKVVAQLRQDDALGAIKLDRVFTALNGAAGIAAPGLKGELQVMRRGDVDLTRYSIVGVHGEGISFGLTDADRQSEALTRRNDYLFADRLDAGGKRVASTSPARLADEGAETLVKVAAHTWVFVLPVDHPEARKFSALKVDWANKARGIADGPGLSRILVGVAAYNLASELWSLVNLKPGEFGFTFTKITGALLDLTAASMKLYLITSPTESTLAGKVILRPLFEIKSVPIIGPIIQKRLLNVGAGTIIRVMPLVNFFAGGVMLGISAWDYRNGVNRGDMDAAFGHGLAVAGGSVFLASPLLSGLLAIPGWGWALFGLGVVLGGSVFAAFATDSELERVLKQGPLGVGPGHRGLPADDAIYYPQLLSQFCPVTVSARRYADLSKAEQALFASHNPSPEDYRVTVRSPLVGRLSLGASPDGESGNARHLRLAMQELEYTQTTLQTPAGQVDEYHLSRETSLKRIDAWVVVPESHEVHFLVKRTLEGGETRTFRRSERLTISLRILLQVRVESEIGVLNLPMPVLEDYEPFDASRHRKPPEKQPGALNPFENKQEPYWIVKEVSV
jgi:hypothetical protein